MTTPPAASGKPRLRRSIGSFAAGSFVVTNMIGTGIFTIPAFVRASTESGLSALGVWLAGGLLALCGAFCYAELAVRMPRVGGEYHYLSRIFGPLWGFLSGWMSFFVGFSAAIAAASIGAVAYLSEAIGWDLFRPSPLLGPISLGGLVAAGLVLLLGLVHSFGLRPGSRLQSMLAGLILGAIALLVVWGLGTGEGDWSRLSAHTQSSSGWWVALIQVSFAYSGWNAAAYLAGEVRDPQRTLPRALVGGTLLVTLTYLSLNLLFLYALPVGSWTANIAVGRLVADVLFGPAGARGLSALITIAIMGGISAMTAAGPRVYYAMARDGLGPRFFGQVSESTSTPSRSILAQSLVAAVLALTGAFEALLIYVGSVLLLFNAMTVAGLYIVRRNQGDNHAGFKVPGYPVTPALFLTVVIFAWTYALIQRPTPTLAALLTLLGGVVVYRIGRNRGLFDYRAPSSESASTGGDSPVAVAGEG